MRLTEISEKVRNTRIPARIFEELWIVEVDTVDDDSSDAKKQLADEMRRAELVKNVAKTPLSRESKEYLLTSALPNLIDIAKDNMDRRLATNLQKFQARLHAALSG